MIHVIATIELAPGTRETYLTEFRKIIFDVRAEKGCIEYGSAIDAQTDLSNQAEIGPDKVVVVEKWEDLAALGFAAHASVSRRRQRLRVRRAFAGARPGRLSRSREIEVANPPRAQRDFKRKVGARYDHETHSLMPHPLSSFLCSICWAFLDSDERPHSSDQ